MKIKFMISFLTYLSVALIHECHAGGVISTSKSTSGVDVKDERRTVPVMPSSHPAPQPPVVHLPQQDLGNAQSIPSSQPTPQPVVHLPRQDLGNAQSIPSSQPTPQPVVHLPQQSLDDAPTATPSVIKPGSSTDERALVPYKMLTFRGYEIPYPQSARVELDEKSTLLLRQAVCSIILLTEVQRDTHELVQKMGSNSVVPKTPDDLNKYFEMIYRDITKIGTATEKVGSADEAIHTLQKLVQHVKLAEIFPHTKFQRSKTSLASRVMITMKDGTGEVIILDVHGLPERLWNQ